MAVSLRKFISSIVIGEAPDATIGSSGVAEGKWSGILSVVASVQWGLLDEELSPDVYNRGYGDTSRWKGKRPNADQTSWAGLTRARAACE